MKWITNASAPRSRKRCTSRRTAASSSGVRTRPAASMRSGTSARRSRGISASKLPVIPYGLGRVRRPSSRTSRSPAVVISPQRAPLRSSTALVATVVPWTSAATAARSVFEHGQPGDEADRLVLGGRSHLGDAEHAALRIERQQIGERAAYIDPDLPCHPLFLAVLGRSRASVLQVLLRKRRRLFQV